MSQESEAEGRSEPRGPWALSTGAFEKLLAVLGPDRDTAGKRYETLRAGLVRLFEWRGCRGAEVLADITIDRVCRRIDEGKDVDPGRAEAYFHGVARNVVKEQIKNQRRHAGLGVSLPAPQPSPLDSLLEESESRRGLECLGWCRQALPDGDRQLVLEYYVSGAVTSMQARSDLAQRHGLSAGSLRVRVHRIRKQLQACLKECLARREQRAVEPGRERA